ncbi:hypothetical protein [Rhodopseudomonas sp.]
MPEFGGAAKARGGMPSCAQPLPWPNPIVLTTNAIRITAPDALAI